MLSANFDLEIIDKLISPLLKDTISESVFLISDNYAKIFGKSLKDYPNEKKAPRIIKIEVGLLKFYRKYVGHSEGGFTLNKIGIDKLTYYEIEKCEKKVESIKISLSKGSAFCFYFNHPLHSVRVAFKLGIVSVTLTFLLGILSIILGILPFIK